MNNQIYEQASEWIVKYRDGGLDAQEKKRFDSWLRESPQHVRAYLEVSAVWEEVPSLDPSWNPDADELIARAHAQENVAPLNVSSPEVPLPHAPRTLPPIAPAWRRAWFAAAASILVAVPGAWFYGQRNTYSTDVGEQRSLVLSDGSTIELNSRSRVRVRFADAERAVDLLDGQALFRVAQDLTRPFVVQSDSARVQAVGTQFDVYRKRAGTVVTVLEGRVAVLAPAEAAERRGGPRAGPREQETEDSAEWEGGGFLLTAGQQITVTPAAATPPKAANVAAATAWTRRSLVFEFSPLTEVAEEFNRYNTRQLVVRDPRLEDFHISGVFSSVDPVILLRFLHDQPELVIEEEDEEIRISKR